VETRANYFIIGLFTLAVVFGVFGFVYWFQNIGGHAERAYYSAVFDGSVSGLRTGATVLFNGIRVGEVTDLKLDPQRPKQVVAIVAIDKSVAVRKDTEVGLEFQGLTGIAAIAFTGGTLDAPPVPLGADGIPELTADPEGLLDVQEKIRVALRNVDKVIADNEVAVKDTLRNFETYTASLSGNAETITSIISAADTGVTAVDDTLGKTQKFLGRLASDKYGGELLPTVISLRELIESFDKKSATLIAETRKMLGDVSQSVNKAGQKFEGPRR
jgi:phospholipid/cholesterol/gamma-HCH transport system substrate-binding protein